MTHLGTQDRAGRPTRGTPRPAGRPPGSVRAGGCHCIKHPPHSCHRSPVHQDPLHEGTSEEALGNALFNSCLCRWHTSMIAAADCCVQCSTSVGNVHIVVCRNQSGWPPLLHLELKQLMRKPFPQALSFLCNFMMALPVVCSGWASCYPTANEQSKYACMGPLVRSLTAGLLYTLMTLVARAQMSVEGCALDRRRSSTPVSTPASASLCAMASRSTAHRQAACTQKTPS